MSEHDDWMERAKARVGTTLNDRWRIDAVLGVGGMAAVYAATHRNQKRVAIKMLHPELSADPGVRARFLREGYVANTVGHRGAVTVDDDAVAEDGSAFLVMELLEGETLEARRARKGGALPASDVLSLMDQLLDTLAAAHDKGIVHRDLKPENLFLTRDGVVKVLDFGIARIRDGATEQRAATRAGAVLGTPAFMAPEQARGKWDLVDARTDLWAVGATMFTLLSGRFVREAETVNEELALAITAHAPSIASVVPELHPSMVALVDKALAYEREARFVDARAMQVAVRQTYAAANAPGTAAPAVPPAPRTSVSSTDAPTGAQPSTLVAAAGSVTVPDQATRTPRPLGVAVAAGVGVLVLAVVGVKLLGGRADAPATGADPRATAAAVLASAAPSAAPSAEPSAAQPSAAPSVAPPVEPSASPSAEPSAAPSTAPSARPRQQGPVRPRATPAPAPQKPDPFSARR